MATLAKHNPETVNLINGVGNDAVPIPWSNGDTVEKILQRANVTLAGGDTVTCGNRRIRHLDTATVKPGDTLVITSKISNGCFFSH